MPRLRQPEKLENIAIRGGIKFMMQICTNLIPSFRSNKEDAKRGERMLKQTTELLTQLYDYNVPCYLFDQLCQEMFNGIREMVEYLKKTIDMRTNSGKFLTAISITVALSESVMSRHLKVLKFDEMPKMLRPLFYNNLSRCTGLVVLDMGAMSGGWKTVDMEPLYMGGLHTLKNLKTIGLAYDCTENILEMLAENSPGIENIDLSNSRLITNKSVHILLKFKNLKTVQLYRTTVSLEGYSDLLLYAPNLTDVGRYDEIGRTLEYLDDWYPQKLHFKLQKFITSYATTKHLQLLCEKCPEIDTVSIFHNVLLIDLMQLIGLDKLSVLKMLSCDFFADRLRDVLQVKGCNLTHLHLEHVDEIDGNALMYVSQFCPDLKIFTIYNCELLESTSIHMHRPTIPPFMNLEKFIFAAKGKRRHLEFILKDALKIKYISFGTQAPACDILFNTVLANNPLEHLEELRIINSDQLTIATAYKVVNTCTNLKVLKELEGWQMVKESELDAFRLYIKARNLDLDITPWRKSEPAR